MLCVYLRQALFDDTTALPEDSSDEDPDFAADFDLEGSKEEDDDEVDWLKLLNSPDREDGGSAAGPSGLTYRDSTARRTRARSKRARGMWALAAVPLTPEVNSVGWW
jgi:hypothetical protein